MNQTRPLLWCKAAVAGVLTTALLAGAALAQDQRDQANDPVKWGGGAVNLLTRPEQTVSPGLSCLTRVEIGLMTGNRGRGGDKITLKLIDWSQPSQAKELAKVSVDVQEGFDGFLSFPMPGAGIKVPPHWLALQVSDTGKNVFWWKYQEGNPYAGGDYYYQGYGSGSRDFLFRTYGHQATCSAYSLSVKPNPVTLIAGVLTGKPLTIGVAREGGFQAPVVITLVLPADVSATPAGLTITGSSGTIQLFAQPTAKPGTFTAMAKDSAGLAQPVSFKINIAASPGAQLSALSPVVQQKNGTLTITGQSFDPTCSLNTVVIAGIGVLPTSCTATSITAKVPPQAAYGPTTVKVNIGDRSSNVLPFRVGRQPGNFTEITRDLSSSFTSRTCVDGTAKVELTQSGNERVATYRKLPGNGLIGSTITFQPDFSYDESFGSTHKIVSFGGAGFSQCAAGLVLDGGTGGLARLHLKDLEKGTNFQASPYSIPVRVPRLNPPMSEYYQPRIFRSPDGTILLVLSAEAESGRGNFTAAVFDRVSNGALLHSVSIDRSSGSSSSVSAKLDASNQITLVFGSQTLPPLAVP